MKRTLTVVAALAAVAVAAPVAGASSTWNGIAPASNSWNATPQVERGSRPKASAGWTALPGASAGWTALPKVERGSRPKASAGWAVRPTPFLNGMRADVF